MKTYKDINNKELKVGDIIDIHQTVNGQNLFVVANLKPLDIRYEYDRNRKYEYDKISLLETDMYGIVNWEIVGTTDDFGTENTFVGYIIGTHPQNPPLHKKIVLSDKDEEFDEEFDNFNDYVSYIMSEAVAEREQQFYDVVRLSSDEYEILKSNIRHNIFD
jgi:hypothetical protein